MHSHTAAASSSPSHHYQYDDAGNRTSVLDLGVTTSYGAANSVNAYTSISGSAAPVYDDNGNMTSGPLGVAGAASSALTYGKENNNLLSASGTQATNFVYDAMGRLVQFSYTENSVTKTEILTWAGWTLMSREIFTGNTVSETFRYTWGTDLSGTLEGAGGVGGMLAVERNVAGSNTWDIRYTHSDANGNIIALTNSIGAVSARYRYDAFGKTINATDVDNSGWVNHNIHGFSSKPSFGNQGLLYYGYRWYSPSLGRWINRDPIEESGGMNLYRFVGNAGVAKWDYLGLDPKNPDGSKKCYNQQYEEIEKRQRTLRQQGRPHDIEKIDKSKQRDKYELEQQRRNYNQGYDEEDDDDDYRPPPIPVAVPKTNPVTEPAPETDPELTDTILDHTIRPMVNHAVLMWYLNKNMWDRFSEIEWPSPAPIQPTPYIQPRWRVIIVW